MVIQIPTPLCGCFRNSNCWWGWDWHRSLRPCLTDSGGLCLFFFCTGVLLLELHHIPKRGVGIFLHI
ncbi:hypothetical protein RchiOBHm_Chr4g0418831 [Rosa chinensis]|uniref:Uncharacterized protein n=1 Tax=Rosa chinensis TaxID=74649 RepID=A0A2P6QXF1_ROSCH|nr:hypothetical protein RchiOBHm_Chr4g0418831 [Rosa chinensis]